MSQRIVHVDIINEYVLGDGVVIGAAGSHDDVLIEMDFTKSTVWAGTTRNVTWQDALGKNPVVTVLTTSLLADGETDIYLVPVPSTAKAIAGDMLVTVEGTEVDSDGNEAYTVISATATFRVLPSRRYTDDLLDIPAAVAVQLQAQVDEVKEDIVAMRGVIQAEDGRVAAETQRRTNENARQDAEAQRVKNENIRIANENARILAEQERVIAESDRVTAENERVEAEAARRSAEADREDQHTGTIAKALEAAYQAEVNATGQRPFVSQTFSSLDAAGSGWNSMMLGPFASTDTKEYALQPGREYTVSVNGETENTVCMLDGIEVLGVALTWDGSFLTCVNNNSEAATVVISAVDNTLIDSSKGYKDTAVAAAQTANMHALNAKAYAEGGKYYNDATLKVYKDVTGAKQYAERAELAAIKQPIIQDGTWWVWDAESGAYTDTGVNAAVEDTGGGSFVVQLTGDGSFDDSGVEQVVPVTGDRTYAEVLAAYNAGQVCEVRFLGEDAGSVLFVLPLVRVDNADTDEPAFTFEQVREGIVLHMAYIDAGDSWSFESLYVPNEGGDGGSITVDSELSATSTNPVQNKVIQSALAGKLGADQLEGAVNDALAQAKESGEFDGADGQPGPDGATPSFSIGTVETLEAGSNATASITGTDAEPVLNLGIPKGADGAAGGSGGGWELLQDIELEEPVVQYVLTFTAPLKYREYVIVATVSRDSVVSNAKATFRMRFNEDTNFNFGSNTANNYLAAGKQNVSYVNLTTGHFYIHQSPGNWYSTSYVGGGYQENLRAIDEVTSFLLEAENAGVTFGVGSTLRVYGR